MNVKFEPVSKTLEVSNAAALPFQFDREITLVEVETASNLPDRPIYSWCPICGETGGEIEIAFIPHGSNFVLGGLAGPGFHGHLHISCALENIRGNVAKRSFMQHYAGLDLLDYTEKQQVKKAG